MNRNYCGDERHTEGARRGVFGHETRPDRDQLSQLKTLIVDTSSQELDLFTKTRQ